MDIPNNNDSRSESEPISLTIHGITHAGEGVGRYGGLAVFVPGAAPGETVLAKMHRLHKKYAQASLMEVQIPSPSRIEPACPHFPGCGGCQLQHLAYHEQLRLKTGLVRDSLSRLGGLTDVPVRDTLGMVGDSFHYRNKVCLQVGWQDSNITLGYYGDKSHTLTALFPGDSPLPGCLLADSGLNMAAAAVQEILNRHIGDTDAGQGMRFFRHILLRKGLGTNETMVVVVTQKGSWPQAHEFAVELMERQPDIRSVVRNLHDGEKGVIMGKRNRLLAGSPTITDRLDHFMLRLSPNSFYQVNPVQTHVLYDQAATFAGLNGRDTVLDAYSGVGSLSLWLAKASRRVLGLEIEPASVTDAQANALLNQIPNADFHLGDVAEILPALASGGVKPDVVMLDPPRRGCSPSALQALVDLNVPRIVYLSCDSGTLARDLAYLTARDYLVEEVQPVDMFPWTNHIECVARIQKRL